MTGNWKEFERKLIARAWEDEEFKAMLLDDPHAAVEQAGLTLPEDVQLRIVASAPGEETPGIHYLVLPANPVVDEANEFELSDKELEVVVGGDRSGGDASHC